MPQQVRITRTKLPTPALGDPEHMTYQIEYAAGELPPHFIYIPVKEWTKEKELKAIKADIEKRMGKAPEIVTI